MPPDLAAVAELARRCREAVGAAHVLEDPSVTASYAVDWTGRFRGGTPLVVRPASTGEVAAVLDAARELGVAVVAQGGNTGLVGGGVPLDGEAVVSLRRLDGIEEVDRDAGQLTAGAGVTIEGVQAAAAAAGWAYGVDWAARATATVGGSVATNAGGVRVLRHGDTRAQVLGVEAVLGDASTISHLGGLVKDNTGYDLSGLLCGSEGTLGVVTAARLRLVAAMPERVVAVLALRGVADAEPVVGALRRALASLEAAELMLADGLALVAAHLGGRAPLAGHPAVVLVECADRVDPTPALAAVVGDLDGVVDAAVAGPADPVRRAGLWRWREAHTEAVNTLGPPVKLDVTVPGGTVAAFCTEVRSRVTVVAPAAACWLFGHVADGNVHVNVTGAAPGDEVAVADAVLGLVAALGGSISAEHGIGTAKRAHLHLSRSPAEIAAMRAVKAALDPTGILNPGVLLPAR